MNNNKNFKYSNEVLYRVIGNLVIDNANQYVEEKYTFDNLASVDYSYDSPHRNTTLKMICKVIDLEENSRVVYTVHKEKLEKYIVTFALTPLDQGGTNLYYAFDLDTDSKKLVTNHKLMSLLYRRREKQKFEALCSYLNQKCEELIQSQEGEL